MSAWNRLEEQIKAISSADDLELIKVRLMAEVEAARAEAFEDWQKAEEARPAKPAVYVPDHLTGLWPRGSAEAELGQAHGQLADCYLALFVVKRLALINAKFGYSRGDQVLVKVVVHLTQSLPEFSHIFRWAPCAFLAMAPPHTSYKEVRSKVQLVELARLTPTLEWEGHSAMVPVVIDCRIVSVRDFGTTSDLFLRLDTLAADG